HEGTLAARADETAVHSLDRLRDGVRRSVAADKILQCADLNEKQAKLGHGATANSSLEFGQRLADRLSALGSILDLVAHACACSVLQCVETARQYHQVIPLRRQIRDTEALDAAFAFENSPHKETRHLAHDPTPVG